MKSRILTLCIPSVPSSTNCSRGPMASPTRHRSPTFRIVPATTVATPSTPAKSNANRSEEHTSELQSQFHLVCRLLLEKKKLQIVVLVRHIISVLFLDPGRQSRLEG